VRTDYRDGWAMRAVIERAEEGWRCAGRGRTDYCDGWVMRAVIERAEEG
jgi:hypothetical protein